MLRLSSVYGFEEQNGGGGGYKMHTILPRHIDGISSLLATFREGVRSMQRGEKDGLFVRFVCLLRLKKLKDIEPV